MTIWEGHDLAPAHRRWRFWVAEGRDELPEFRTSSQVIPFRRGRLHQGGFADRRSLEVRGYIKEVTDPAMQAELDLLKGLLDPERFAPGTLADDFADGTQRWIFAVPRSIIPRYGGQAGRLLSIEIEALDPYWYSAWGTLTLDGGLFLDTGLTLDSSAEIVVVPTTSSHELDIDTLGTADVERVRIAFKGPSTAPPGFSATLASGETVGFTYGALLLSGEELVVDNHDRTVLLGGATKRNLLNLSADNRHGEYARLSRGLNQVRITGQPAEARIRFTPTWQ